MRPYEVVVIYDGINNDGEIRKNIERLSAQLKAGGAEIRNVDIWGRRRFAYEINHKTEGFYAIWEMKAPQEIISEVSKALTIADEIVRHKVIRLPDHIYDAGPQKSIRVRDNSRDEDAPRRRSSRRESN